MPTQNSDEKQLRELLSRRTHELPRAGWSCPDENLLAAFVEDSLTDEAAGQIERHLKTCPHCLQQVVFLFKTEDLSDHPAVPRAMLEQARRLGRSSPKRHFLSFGVPAAATAFVLVLAFLFWLPSSVSVPSQPPFQTDRGSETQEFRLLSPASGFQVTRFPARLRWEPVEEAFSYEVRIADLNGSLVWQRRTELPEVSLSQEPALRSGEEYYVYVRAHLPEGRVIRSDMVRLRIETTDGSR